MRRILILLAAVAGYGCADSADKDREIDQTFTAEMASQSLSQGLPSSDMLKVHAICGPSVGKGLYDDDSYQNFQNDGISNGRLIFYSGSDNSGPNVLYRDAGGRYISALEDGAEVRILDPENRVWIIAYPSTGVVETHNLLMRDGKLFDLWTSNKPAVAAWGPSARIFTSFCFRS